MNNLKDGENLPLVSVITPSFNSSRYIEECIVTVIDQTYTNWEMLIVDDCSSDNTKEIIKKYCNLDSRIKFFSLKSNSGAAVARNTALEAAKGKYVAFLDSDDVWLPKKLELQVSFMEKNDYAFSFTQYIVINGNGERKGEVRNIPMSIDYKGLLKNTIIGCLTVMINVEKVGKVKMPNIKTRQDYVTWLGILKRGYIAYGLKEVLSKYRVTENSISSNKWKVAKRNWQVYRQIEGLSFPYALWCFLNYAFHAIQKRI